MKECKHPGVNSMRIHGGRKQKKNQISVHKSSESTHIHSGINNVVFIHLSKQRPMLNSDLIKNYFTTALLMLLTFFLNLM
jgi:hypothetical protein